MRQHLHRYSIDNNTILYNVDDTSVNGPDGIKKGGVYYNSDMDLKTILVQ